MTVTGASGGGGWMRTQYSDPGCHFTFCVRDALGAAVWIRCAAYLALFDQGTALDLKSIPPGRTTFPKLLLRAFALRSCLFMSSFSCTSQDPSDPTTGMFGPEMQATPWIPDVSSQVVSGPNQGSGSTLPMQPSSRSPPQ